jgi:aspartate kinase
VVNESVAKVSVVGAGMKSNPGIAAKVFRVLADNGINIDMISTSAIRISVVIDGSGATRAMQTLHTAFGLDSDQLFEETQLTNEELAAKAEKGR